MGHSIRLLPVANNIKLPYLLLWTYIYLFALLQYWASVQANDVAIR